MDPRANPDRDTYRYSDGRHLTPNPRRRRDRLPDMERGRLDYRSKNEHETNRLQYSELEKGEASKQSTKLRQPSPPRIHKAEHKSRRSRNRQESPPRRPHHPGYYSETDIPQDLAINQVSTQSTRLRQPSPPRIHRAGHRPRLSHNYRASPPPPIHRSSSERRHRSSSDNMVPSPTPLLVSFSGISSLVTSGDSEVPPPLPQRYTSPVGHDASIAPTRPIVPTPLLHNEYKSSTPDLASFSEEQQASTQKPHRPYAIPQVEPEPRSLPPLAQLRPMHGPRTVTTPEALAVSMGGESVATNTERHSFPGTSPVRPTIVIPSDSRSDVQRPGTASDITSASGTIFSRASSGSRTVKVGTYRYDPLDKLQIRLVKIQSVKGWQVKCEIFPASLEHPPPYIAISYAWGDPDQRSEIVLEREITDDAGRVTVERTPHRVTTSLYGALDALRDKRSEVFVWVDALCINQKDNEERTKQIEMMTDIYRRAESVAIWLGPEADSSDEALHLLKSLRTDEEARKCLETTITSGSASLDLLSLVALFEREYWDRLWVVQEVFNARSKTVYCGSAKIDWGVFEIASQIFFEHKNVLDNQQPDELIEKKRRRVSQNHFSYSQVLVYQGPSSLPDVKSLMSLEHPLLGVMRACRRKLTAKPQDKVFGLLGVLPEHIRREFMVDYDLSVKEVYIKVVDYVLSTTDRLDIIREAIHFPLHTGSAGLPTWCPDWSHIPETRSLERSPEFPPFAASESIAAVYKPVDDHRKLEISAVYLDTIKQRGVAVGTLTTLSDQIMAFLHWRALFLGFFDIDAANLDHPKHSAFCRTLCLDQILPGWDQPGQWETACYYAFASLISERLPALPIDKGLMHYLDFSDQVLPSKRRPFLRRHFASHMMGRCFFLTEDSHMGMGTGFMAVGDIVVVPLGCSTPIVLRPEGRNGEFRYVGDVYVDQYMMGEAVQDWKAGQKELRKYLLH